MNTTNLIKNLSDRTKTAKPGMNRGISQPDLLSDLGVERFSNCYPKFVDNVYLQLKVYAFEEHESESVNVELGRNSNETSDPKASFSPARFKENSTATSST